MANRNPNKYPEYEMSGNMPRHYNEYHRNESGEMSAAYGKLNSIGTVAASQEGFFEDDKRYVTTMNQQQMSHHQQSEPGDAMKKRRRSTVSSNHRDLIVHQNFNTKKEKEKYYRQKIKQNKTNTGMLHLLRFFGWIYSLFAK